MICCCHEQKECNKPTDVLKNEHRVIEKVLDAMERELQSEMIRKSFFEQAIDFLKNFADGCHHAKEEDQLFPLLESAGIPRDGGPIGCMLHEHQQGRMFIGQMVDNLDRAQQGEPLAVNAVRHAAHHYIALLRAHIQKEDNVLFMMADHVLNQQQQDSLMTTFDRTEACQGADGQKHRRYVVLAEELATMAK